MKTKPPKPYNGYTWTVARMRSFVMSALRRAQWPAKYKAISKAYVKDGYNPKTGKLCKLHKCPECGEIGPKGNFQADHITPVVPLEQPPHLYGGEFLGYNWNEIIKALYCEEDGFRAICKKCHKQKSKEENKQRRALRSQNVTK